MKKLACLTFCAAGVVLTAGPASAVPIPVPQAKTELNAAATNTNNVASYKFTDTHNSVTASYDATGKYESTLSDGEAQRIFSGDGNYSTIYWPSDAVKQKVQSADYLGHTVEWQFIGVENPFGLPMWPQIANGGTETRWGLIPGLPWEDSWVTADKTANLTGGFQYKIMSSAGMQYTFIVDGAGRISRIERTDADDDNRSWEFVPVTIDTPPADVTEPLATVRKATEAASLNQNLYALTKSVALNCNNRKCNLKRMRNAAKYDVWYWNEVGYGNEEFRSPRYVKFKIANISGGTRVYRKNPYTGTKHEWRIIKKNGKWKPKKFLP